MKRFWDKVERTDKCWLWTAASHRGYGRFRFDGIIPEHKRCRTCKRAENARWRAAH